MRPEYYTTMPSIKAQQAKSLGYTQYYPGNAYVYFVEVRQIFAYPTYLVGPSGLCPFCNGDPYNEQDIPNTNIKHYIETGGRHLCGGACPMCEGRSI